jgi:hypothetical protein
MAVTLMPGFSASSSEPPPFDHRSGAIRSADGPELQDDVLRKAALGKPGPIPIAAHAKTGRHVSTLP